MEKYGSKIGGKAIRTLFLVLTVMGGAAAYAEPVLNDQFGESADLASLIASPRMILLHSDERDGIERISAMRKAVAGTAKAEGLSVVCVTELSALPFFVPKSAVTAQAKKEITDFRLFLDWKGALRARLKLPKGSIARSYADGRLLAEVEAGADAAAFAAFLAAR